MITTSISSVISRRSVIPAVFQSKVKGRLRMMAPQAERSFGWRRPEKIRLDESFNETHEAAQTGTTPTKEHKKVVVECNVLPSAITFELQGVLEHAELEFVTLAVDLE